ncbi:MAG: TrpB-like pyridoxal phosphate-dependent enzyme [Anaerolineae bacterium]|nr:TrpB-like pyridoxal phosphate-dependent enzyme [Caldilineales bacterium]MDW8268468.1 TrpB-like pyridoxal phosphate-dependent enzyme [Anaerolineae bacterium]
MPDSTKILLSEADIPQAWYNIQPDLPGPLPPVIHPGTLQPIGPDDLAPLFPMALIAQEVSQERWIEIPEPVRDIYRLWRPTPLFRARRLERYLDTPAHLYYKYEGVSPAGSHKPNTAVAQAFYNKEEGVKALTTETGAGQWGSSLAMACNFFGLGCEVFMVKVSYEQKPYRRSMMQTWGATVYPSPSTQTQAGRRVLAEHPDSPGSLGIAISEAVEAAATSGGVKKYSLGSVLNHVLLHQTVIGQEVMKQMELAGEYPDILIGCVGGGSNFGGFTLPFVREKLVNGRPTRIIAVEPTAAPSLTKGKYVYDFGDTGKMTPLIKMYTLGSSFIPAPIHAGGLRYHGMAPIVCYLYDLGVIEAVAVPQNPVFEAAVTFARCEGIMPAPEPSHAIRVAIDEALKCKETGEKKVIVFHVCGHGHFDMAAYDAYFAGKLPDYEYPAEEVEKALADLPAVG